MMVFLIEVFLQRRAQNVTDWLQSKVGSVTIVLRQNRPAPIKRGAVGHGQLSVEPESVTAYRPGMHLHKAATASGWIWLIRLMVGTVFLSEGIQKFLFPAEVGSGRFANIGLPSPEILGPLVGGFEIACGTLVLLGLFTRLAVIPLLTIMAVAIYSTKIPILLKSGFWRMAHDSRTDFAMTLGALFLLVVGAGAWSLDAWLQKRGGKHDGSKT